MTRHGGQAADDTDVVVEAAVSAAGIPHLRVRTRATTKIL
jgi:hypothetical protein